MGGFVDETTDRAITSLMAIARTCVPRAVTSGSKKRGDVETINR